MQQPWRAIPATVSGGTNGAPVVLNNGAYGYGLRIRQTCDYRQIVAHSGGLPGFGSQMRWLVDEGVGFVAMGNLTYTGWNGVLDQATDILAKTGGLTRRMPEPSQALLAAKSDVSRLVASWDDALADRIAAVNLFLDESKDRRRRQIDGYRTQYRRLPSRRRVRRRERLAWRMDDDVRPRQAACLDHTGADDAAESAIPQRAACGGDARETRLRVVGLALSVPSSASRVQSPSSGAESVPSSRTSRVAS